MPNSPPVMVTVVPPRLGPVTGAIDEAVGAARVSRAMAVPQAQEFVGDAANSEAIQTSLGLLGSVAAPE
jgi:hypothetical protein